EAIPTLRHSTRSVNLNRLEHGQSLERRQPCAADGRGWLTLARAAVSERRADTQRGGRLRLLTWWSEVPFAAGVLQRHVRRETTLARRRRARRGPRLAHLRPDGVRGLHP